MSSRLRGWIGFTCVFIQVLALNCVKAQDPAPDLLPPGDWQFTTPHSEDASLEKLQAGDATVPGHGEAVRLTVRVPSQPVWLIQISRAISADVPEGNVVQLHFWARSATSNPLRVSIEQVGAPYHGIGGGMITLTPDWKEYRFSGPSLGFGPGGLSVHFQAGRQAGSVEITGVTATDTGPESIPAAVRDALRPEQIAARIEKYRKGDLTVRVEDASGHGLKAITVKVTETRSAFLFGANIFALRPGDTSPLQLAYQDRFTALFNYATLPFYWGSFEPQAGHPHYDRLDEMARWGLAHGLTLKGHPLIYHIVWPTWAPLTPDAAIPLLRARVTDIISHFKDEIHYWDVLNEANSAAENETPNGESAWIRRDGPSSVVGTALDWARAARDASGADATFIYNDYDTSKANLDLLTQLQAAGKLPDVIGIQSHMHEGHWPLAKVWQVCETFARFGRPIHFTETTVLSGPRRLGSPMGEAATNWNSTPEDEAKQGDYVPQFYTLLFSHPAVRAITWWDLSDNDSWMSAPAGLLRKDMSPKPAYTRLMDLIHHQWWTNVDGTTDATGAFTTRAFYGDYQLTLTAPDGRTKTQTLHFPDSAKPLTVTLQLP